MLQPELGPPLDYLQRTRYVLGFPPIQPPHATPSHADRENQVTERQVTADGPHHHSCNFICAFPLPPKYRLFVVAAQLPAA